ncbi:hypothetical protein DKX38_000951 [Salix brachista]|uniref:Uncharacterized protein n=1 Tax=Salix brachista TaxID=2182728 RepID=A0A5N5P3D9_9ROSI|nr:hypothetical protein DKX38_000951 [Salix brachista]
MDQALAEIWFSRDCNQAPDCASQLMQFLRHSAPFHPIPVSGMQFDAHLLKLLSEKKYRLRVTLCATHTADDLKKLTAALSCCINFQDIGLCNSRGTARL